jgi:hypothetical protein
MHSPVRAQTWPFVTVMSPVYTLTLDCVQFTVPWVICTFVSVRNSPDCEALKFSKKKKKKKKKKEKKATIQDTFKFVRDQAMFT